jgi:hypothetical protein
MKKVWVAVQEAYGEKVVFGVYTNEDKAVKVFRAMPQLINMEVEDLSLYGGTRTKRYKFHFKDTTVTMMDYEVE